MLKYLCALQKNFIIGTLIDNSQVEGYYLAIKS